MKTACVALAIVLAGCPRHDKPSTIEPTAKHDAQPSRLLPDDDSGLALVLPPAPPIPKPPAGLPPLPDRPELAAITADAIALGELLFHDPRLASDGKTACATCHDPAHDYAGAQDTTASGQKNLRRTPTLVNLAWNKEFGWDGRYPSLEQHLAAHLKGQLGDGLDSSLHKIAELPIYRAHLARVGGTPQEAALRALEAFALTRYQGDSPWDKRERNPQAAADDVALGYKLFIGKARCAICHTPPLYTDLGYHHVANQRFEDPGRGRVDPAQPNAFKTPTLRGASGRIAFFHTGDATTLEQVVEWYTSDATASQKGIDPVITKIRLSASEQVALLAFVRALTASSPPPTKPVLP